MNLITHDCILSITVFLGWEQLKKMLADVKELKAVPTLKSFDGLDAGVCKHVCR